MGGQVSWHIKRLWWFAGILRRYVVARQEKPIAFAWYWSGRRAAIGRMVEQGAKPRAWVKP